jgi:hypothetical protein
MATYFPNTGTPPFWITLEQGKVARIAQRDRPQHRPARQRSQRWQDDHRRHLHGGAGSGAFQLLRGLMVGATGIEPVTSSVSATHREPLCGRPFRQVTLNRNG